MDIKGAKGLTCRGDINQASLKPSAEAVYVHVHELLICQLSNALPDLTLDDGMV